MVQISLRIINIERISRGQRPEALEIERLFEQQFSDLTTRPVSPCGGSTCHLQDCGQVANIAIL